MTDIQTRIEAYGLPEDQESVLLQAILETRARRLAPQNVSKFLREHFTLSVTVRASGMDDFEERLDNLTAHFRQYNREYK